LFGFQTPLHLAAYYGATGMVELLISKGADVHAKNVSIIITNQSNNMQYQS